MDLDLDWTGLDWTGLDWTCDLLPGHATKLQPVAVLLCILFFGTLWGILGMVMAVPLTAVTRIILMNVSASQENAAGPDPPSSRGGHWTISSPSTLTDLPTHSAH